MVKGAIDDAVEGAVESAARNGVDGPVGAKLKEARRAVVAQNETFAAKDVVQQLIDFKKGTRTDLVMPDKAITEVLAGVVTNLKKLKAVLLTQPTAQSKAAWRAIQAEGERDTHRLSFRYPRRRRVAGRRWRSVGVYRYGSRWRVKLFRPKNLDRVVSALISPDHAGNGAGLPRFGRDRSGGRDGRSSIISTGRDGRRQCLRA